MRVLMVNRFFYPYLGGVEFHILNLAQELQRHGCTVTVACERSEGSAAEELFRGVRVRRLGSVREFGALMAEGFDVVHGHMPRKPFVMAGLLAARRRGIPTVFTPHCFYPGGGTAKVVLKELVDRTLTRALLRGVDATINLTENDRRDAIERGLPPARSRVIPNSIRASELEATAPADFRAAHGITGDFIAHVGRFDTVKNIHFLVEAHDGLPAGLRLVLVGQDDGELPRVRQAIAERGLEERVTIVERASFRELLGLYREARVVVMASAYEGLPTVLLEAMYFGTPVVAAAVGGIPYLLTDPALGETYAFGDSRAYVAAVRRALDDTAERRLHRRQVVTEQYSWEVNALRVLAVYRELSARVHARAA
jgi:glycosyltransferase involved in cell wall biosynthesis